MNNLNKISIKDIAIELAMSSSLLLNVSNTLFNTRHRSVLKKISNDDAARLYEYVLNNSLVNQPKQKRKYIKSGIRKKFEIRKQEVSEINQNLEISLLNMNLLSANISSTNPLAQLFKI